MPFAGVPSELRERFDQLMGEEPEYAVDEADVGFSVLVPTDEQRPFTLRRFVAPYWRSLLGALILVIVETATGLVGPVLTQIGIDDGIGAGSIGVLVAASVGYLVAVAANVAVGGARIAWTGRVGERLMLALRVRVFTHLQRQSLGWFTNERAGRVMTRMTSDIDALSALFQDGLVNLVVQALTVVVVTTVLFSYDATLAVVTLCVVVPAMTVATLWFRTRSDRAYGAVRRRLADVLADLQESLAGIRLVTAHNRQGHNIERHRRVLAEYRDANVHTGILGALYAPGTELVATVGQAALLVIGGHRVLRGELSVGELTAFILFLATFFAPIQQLVNLYTTYQSGQAAAVKLRELLGMRPAVAEAPDAYELPPIEGEIRLDGVSFGYGASPVLHDVDLTIHPGETFALVGPTGSGKSTIAKLVTRFYDPTDGTVSVDGHDLRGVTLDSLRRQLGVVPQEPFLFAGSVRDNIAFGGRAGASEEDLANAVRVLGLGELVGQLPQGLDTPVHQGGSSLSSGQRQLLALARAFVARPRVLVLDEATSSLDLRSEAIVERALDAVLEGRTAILIAHRLATAMRADRIAVVDDGRIVEVGTHYELVHAGGRYAALFAAWSSSAANQKFADDSLNQRQETGARSFDLLSEKPFDDRAEQPPSVVQVHGQAAGAVAETVDPGLQ